MADGLDVQDQERSEEDIAFTIGTSVTEQILLLQKRLSPDVLHIFTHADSDYRGESINGLFQPRSGYYSALSKKSGVMRTWLNLTFTFTST